MSDFELRQVASIFALMIAPRAAVVSQDFQKLSGKASLVVHQSAGTRTGGVQENPKDIFLESLNFLGYPSHCYVERGIEAV